MTPAGVDTSVAVPLLLTNHRAHVSVEAWCDGQSIALAGHALAETYSVLTRLPGALRLLPEDAAELMRERFAPPLPLNAARSERLPATLAGLGIFGGAVYDALVGLAAVDNDVELATRDERAHRTYERVGARVTRVT